MTKEQEQQILDQARAILEARADDQAHDFALENDVKVDLQRIAYYAAFYHGALNAALEIVHELTVHRLKTREDWLYMEAWLRLATSSKRNMQLYLAGEEIGFRNHETDKKGRLKNVEAYFMRISR